MPKRHRHPTKLLRATSFRPIALGIVALFLVTGLVLAYRAQAATHTASSEAEAGAPAGNASTRDGVAGASATSAVRFGGGTPEPTGPVLYVATAGNDGNDGKTAGAPKKTIAAAMSAASPGHTILVGSGTYNGNMATTKGGAAGNFITVRSQVRHGAVIVGGDKDSAVDIRHPYVRFQDFTVTGSETRNGFLVSATNVEVIGNHIHGIAQFLTGGTGWEGGAGIYTSSEKATSNILLDSNRIHDVGLASSRQQLIHGMYLPTHVTNGRVTNNVIYRVEDFGLHPYDETEASGWQFINNTIANTGRGILQAPGGVTRNNIVYNTRGARYDIRGSGNVVSNNIGGGTGSGSMSGVTSADPLFVDAAAHDYRIRSGSPAIDKGFASGAPAADYLGIARPRGAGIDIGAYELQ